MDQGLLIHEVSRLHNDAPQSVGLLWASDHFVAKTSTWQHTQKTNVHALGDIRTHNFSRRAAVDLRLRPHGYWDRQLASIVLWITEKLNELYNEAARILSEK